MLASRRFSSLPCGGDQACNAGLRTRTTSLRYRYDRYVLLRTGITRFVEDIKRHRKSEIAGRDPADIVTP